MESQFPYLLLAALVFLFFIIIPSFRRSSKEKKFLKNLKKGVRLVKNKYETEASGNVNLKNIRKIASTGINRISIGSLTHSVSAIDLKLEI